MSQRASDKKARALNISNYQRHILLCTGPKCCSEEAGGELWTYLKERLNELGLANVPQAPIFRSKVGCLRICSDGPVAVVYPEGVWYRLLDKPSIDEIIQKHLINGQIVNEYAIDTNSEIQGVFGKPLK